MSHLEHVNGWPLKLWLSDLLDSVLWRPLFRLTVRSALRQRGIGPDGVRSAPDRKALPKLLQEVYQEPRPSEALQMSQTLGRLHSLLDELTVQAERLEVEIFLAANPHTVELALALNDALTLSDTQLLQLGVDGATVQLILGNSSRAMRWTLTRTQT